MAKGPEVSSTTTGLLGVAIFSIAAASIFEIVDLVVPLRDQADFNPVWSAR